MALTVQEEMLIEMRVANDGKRTSTAYMFWLFLGGFGAHRFYTDNPATATMQLLLTLTFVGLVITIPWVIIDAFWLPTAVKNYNSDLRDSLAIRLMAYNKKSEA
jgi:TM2 domain-containing membrane protein YozV